jgi:hypothetical protein
MSTAIEQMRLVFGRILEIDERTIAMPFSYEMYILHAIISWIFLPKKGHKEELKFMESHLI